MNSVLTFLQSNRQRLALERYGASERLSCVALTPRFRASGHVVFLIFAEGKSDPVLVAKVPRLAGAVGIEREAANLRAVQTSRPGGFGSIPRVIAFEEHRGRPLLVETALVGQPMNPVTVRRDLSGCCGAVSGWLADVQEADRCPAGAGSDWFERLIERALHLFVDAFPLSAEETRLLERTRGLVAPLRGAGLPLVFEHGDLSDPNVLLLKDGGIGVVDWELAEPRGMPACDLFFFLTYAAFALHNARSPHHYVAAFQEAFFGRAAWARPYVRAYAERLQLPLHMLTPLFVLCWARYTINLALRLGDARRSQEPLEADTAAWLRANRYYALWKHTVAHVNDLDWHDLPQTKTRSD